MARAGIELLIVSDPSDMARLTGYDGWSFYVHQCVLIPPDGEPVWFVAARMPTALSEQRGSRTITSSATPIITCSRPNGTRWEVLARLIAERGWDRLSIGVEMDNYWFSAAAYATLQRHLPNARFADATALVNWQRAVKSPRELEYMRRAARIVEAMHQRILEKIEPGMRKCDLVAEIYDAAIRRRGRGRGGGLIPAVVPLLPSGEEASVPHPTWDDRPLREGGSGFKTMKRFPAFQIRLLHQVLRLGGIARQELGRPVQVSQMRHSSRFKVLQAGLGLREQGDVRT